MPTGAISICRRFSKASHRCEAETCGLSLLAIFTFWVFTLWLITCTLVLYSKRKSSITASVSLTTKLIPKQARLTLLLISCPEQVWQKILDREANSPDIFRGIYFPKWKSKIKILTWHLAWSTHRSRILLRLMSPNTLGTRGFSRVRWEFSVLAEGRSHARVTIKTWQKPETALEKSLAPRVVA